MGMGRAGRLRDYEMPIQGRSQRITLAWWVASDSHLLLILNTREMLGTGVAATDPEDQSLLPTLDLR